MNFYKTVVYYFLPLFLLSCGTNKKGGFPYLEERNQGLKGDRITSLEISPVDSSKWALNCLNRVYIANNFGENWEQLEYPYSATWGSLTFTKNGKLVYLKDTLIAIQDNDGKFIRKALPSGDIIQNFYRDSNNFLKLIIETKEKKIFLRNIDNFSYNHKQISQREYDGLIHQNWFQSEISAADSTFVDYAGGHILLYTDSTKKPIKRMNGLNKPGIVGFLQSEKSPEIVYAIQRGRYTFNTIFNIRYLYKSENFGKSWTLIDSSDSGDLLLKRNKSEYNFTKTALFQERDKTGLFNLDKISINDSFALSKTELGVVLNYKNDSNSTFVIIPSNFPNYHNYLPIIKGVHNVPLYVAKVEGDSVKLLVASQNGGVLFFKNKIRE